MCSSTVKVVRIRFMASAFPFPVRRPGCRLQGRALFTERKDKGKIVKTGFTRAIGAFDGENGKSRAGRGDQPDAPQYPLSQ